MRNIDDESNEAPGNHIGRRLLHLASAGCNVEMMQTVCAALTIVDIRPPQDGRNTSAWCPPHLINTEHHLANPAVLVTIA